MHPAHVKQDLAHVLARAHPPSCMITIYSNQSTRAFRNKGDGDRHENERRHIVKAPVDRVFAHFYNLLLTSGNLVIESFSLALDRNCPLQVRDEVEKYTQGKTTSSIYMEVNPGGLQLPSVTLCPGFKQGTFESANSFRYPHILKMLGRNKTMPATEEEIWDWFEARTYNLDEGILSNQCRSVIHELKGSGRILSNT